MAAPQSIPALLESLTQSLSSALEIGPKVSAIDAPENGVSLLEVKNELLLSYLQNLAFLILVKLRNAKAKDKEKSTELYNDVVKKLTELRLYLEKGVRPLEEKLRFSLENMLRAANDAERKKAGEAKTVSKSTRSKKSAAETGSDDGSASNSDAESDMSESSDEDDEDEDEKPRRPQLAGFTKLVEANPPGDSNDKPGIWRPSKTRRVLMPEPEKRERRERVPLKSATVEEYVANELVSGPIAEPSVGTTILDRGRKVKTAEERRRDDERREYEERNFTRLPVPNKKERAKQAKLAGKSGRMVFGGEEWRDLGEGVDRIDRLTRRKDGSSGTRALLERSRKRQHESSDGPRQSGAHVEMGERFNKRLKVLEAGRRDRGRQRK
ncbi:hypothetical protein jhhlp_003921 [Lomentospora prolificans]|uniref:Sas10 C-terminal domain-containing protein n=1 Tax=Lomentospora prolificans TaxID=41688 RepID=A0A2N3NA81_9PEZI|nr:hypothetical protein jhhlp_003921 [Lomentospora prolificans]